MSLVEKITAVIDSEVRPAIESHGGGIEFVGFDEATGILSESLTRMCAGCPGARATLRNMVEQVVRESVPEVKEVVQARA